MELVYITRAIRRYWWATAGLLIAGLAVGLFASAGSAQLYQTEAWVLLGAPADSFNAATDREIQNQLVVLESEGLADLVADTTGVPAAEVLASTEFRQIPGSDVIAVVATNSSPERAQAIANAYVDAYMAAREEAVRSTSMTDLDSIDETIETIAANIDSVNTQIEQAMAPFVAAVAADPSALLPTIDQVAPRLATQREVLITQYSLTLQRRAEAEDANNRLDVGSQVVQAAALPETAGQQLSLRFLAAVFAGSVFGVLAAIALARISPRVLDEDEVVEILGVPLAATLPKVRHLGPLDRQLESAVPGAMRPTVRQLCVSAEAAAAPGEALTVVVAGSARRSGATTLALAMAKQFALSGTDVLLVDADTSHPALTSVVGEETSGVFALIGGPRKSARSATSQPDPVIEFESGTDRPSRSTLHFAGLGDNVLAERRLRRQDASSVLTAAAAAWPVVVVDAGPLMDSASSIQFAQLADVVVLAVPVRHQRRAPLTATAMALRASVGHLLTVCTTLSHAGASPRSLPDRLQQKKSPGESDTGENTDGSSASRSGGQPLASGARKRS